MVSVTLKDGTTFRGDSAAEVMDAMRAYNAPHGTKSPDVWYYSESKERDIRIEEMNDIYLRNALIKRYEMFPEQLRLSRTMPELNNMVLQGPIADPVLMGLYREVAKRARR